MTTPTFKKDGKRYEVTEIGLCVNKRLSTALGDNQEYALIRDSARDKPEDTPKMDEITLLPCKKCKCSGCFSRWMTKATDKIFMIECEMRGCVRTERYATAREAIEAWNTRPQTSEG